MQDLRRTRNERQRTSLRKMDVRFPRRVMTMNQAGLREAMFWPPLGLNDGHWSWFIGDLYVVYIRCHYNDGLIIWFILVFYICCHGVFFEIAPPATEDCESQLCTATRRFRWRDGLLQMLQVHRSGLIDLWDSQDETTAESVETQQAHVTLEVVVVCKPLQAAP